MLLNDDLSAAAKHPQQQHQQSQHIGEKPQQHIGEKSALSWALKGENWWYQRDTEKSEKEALDIDRQGAR